MKKVVYKVEWKDEALESLAKLGSLGDKIRIRVEKHLASNPERNGKPLKRNLEGLHRYRCFGDYRVIYQLLQKELIIIALDVGHRWEDFYEKFEERWMKQHDLNESKLTERKPPYPTSKKRTTTERPTTRDLKRKVGKK